MQPWKAALIFAFAPAIPALPATPPAPGGEQLLRRAADRVLKWDVPGPVLLLYRLRLADGRTGTYRYFRSNKGNWEEELIVGARTASAGAVDGVPWEDVDERLRKERWFVDELMALRSPLELGEGEVVRKLASRESSGRFFVELTIGTPAVPSARSIFLATPSLDLAVSESAFVRQAYVDWKELRAVGAFPGVCRLVIEGRDVLDMQLEFGSTQERPIVRSDPSAWAGMDDKCRCTAITVPKATSKTAPTYPEEVRRLRLAGPVVLNYTIGATGIVRDIRVVYTPSRMEMGPARLLTDAAIAAVSQWRYDPARCDGDPIEITGTAIVKFELR